MQHGVDAEGRLGYHRHRSHDVLAVADCPISHPDLAAVGHLGQTWPRAARVDVAAAPTTGERLVVVTPASPAGRRLTLPDVDASVAVGRPAIDRSRPLTRVRGRTGSARR